MNRSTRIAIAVACLLALAVGARAQVPPTMTVQGRLTDAAGNPVAPGPKTFTFRVFDAPVGGNEIWPGGPGDVQVIVTDTEGLWTAAVGSSIPLSDVVFSDTAEWLDVTVDDGLNPPETLPRIKLNTSPYAFRVGHATHATTADIALASLPDNDWTVLDSVLYTWD